MSVDLLRELRTQYFAFVDGEDMRTALAEAGDLSDWDAFAASWNKLPQDTYMADGGRYRQRRHGVFQCSKEGKVIRRPDQPHYQSTDRNPLNGGIQRWFEPISPDIATGPTMQTVFGYCHALFDRLQPETTDWHVETHQFRIIAKTGEEGRPTPEGMHRDGVDFVLVMLIKRQDVESGETTVSDLKKKKLGSFTLTRPFDAALVNDRFVYHGVTPIVPADGAGDAHRDVLVVTWVDRRRAVGPV